MVLSTTMTDTMPQTVPSLAFATSTASFDLSAAFTADSFDLSLLPSSGCDSEVPYSPQNDHQLLLSLYYDTTSPPPMFPAQLPADQELYKQPVIKEEPFTSSLHHQHQQQNCWDTSSCCSSNPSPEYCASPQYPISPKIKQETTIDLEEILKESKYLQDNYYHSPVPPPPQPPSQQQRRQENKKDLIIRTILERDEYEHQQQQQQQKPVTDHQLLREVLKDTSFQRKYNLKPFDIGGLGTAFKTEIKMEVVEGEDPGEGQSGEPSSSCPVDLTQENIEPVFSLAIEQLKEDVNNTCTVLGISRDPTQWSVEDVRSWLVWNLQQYNLPMSVVEYFSVSGATLVQLTEEEFQQRTPQCGSLLHAQLEIWKAACLQGTNIDVSGLLHDSTTQSSSSCGDASDDDDDEEIADSPQTSHSSPQSKTSGRGGSHIHLWQFLKELLATPQVHGACIRWIDRSKGIFKIEDSVRVARLWGKRKNRPAMNYDKLSRSIRQYYKKGIMKKTERSQRLVYQFCHPYCL